MKLFYGGYGKYQHYVVAEDAGKAVAQIQGKYNLGHLPVTVKPIDDIDGYVIKPVKVGEEVENTGEEIGEGEEGIRRKRPRKNSKG